METKHLLIGIVVVLIAVSAFQAYSMIGLTKKLSTAELMTAPAAKAVAPPIQTQTRQIQLPGNIQSSAPIQFKSFEEEVAYYKKNTNNPRNINIENAVRNMDANLDGQCDKCGMAVLHCIEQGMEDM